MDGRCLVRSHRARHLEPSGYFFFLFFLPFLSFFDFFAMVTSSSATSGENMAAG
jgi:hypothetical protein